MEECIGRVTHYFNKIGVAVLWLTTELKVNDTIQVLGHTTDLIQKVHSLEINHHKIQSAYPGVEVALRVDEPVHKGDKIYIVTEDMLLEEGLERSW